MLEYEVEAGAFDAAVMVFGHFSGEDQRKVFEKILRAVKTGGIIMIEVYSKEQLEYGTGGPREADMLYDPKDILEWSTGRHLLHFFCGERCVRKGGYIPDWRMLSN